MALRDVNRIHLNYAITIFSRMMFHLLQLQLTHSTNTHNSKPLPVSEPTNPHQHNGITAH